MIRVLKPKAEKLPKGNGRQIAVQAEPVGPAHQDERVAAREAIQRRIDQIDPSVPRSLETRRFKVPAAIDRAHPSVRCHATRKSGPLGVETRVNKVIATAEWQGIKAKGSLDALLYPQGTSTNSTGPWQWTSLREIQIGMFGENAGWFYNGFFANLQLGDRMIYQQYYAVGVGLPANATPSPMHGSSTTLNPPSNNGTPGMSLNLREIRLTSLYGGSVRLKFVLEEDYHAELRKDQDAWDLLSLTMDIYVSIVGGNVRGFNADRNRPNLAYNGASSKIHVEFTSAMRAAYHVEAASWTRVKDSNAVAASAVRLHAYLTELAAGIGTRSRGLPLAPAVSATPFRDTIEFIAGQFAYGFLHTQLRNRITDINTVVDAIQITDDFIDVRTHQGQYVFSVRARVRNIYMDTEPGDEEGRVTLDAAHSLSSNGDFVNFDARTYPVTVSEDLNPFNSPATAQTPWFYIGSWTVNELRDNNGVPLHWLEVLTWVHLRESDMTYDDEFIPAEPNQEIPQWGNAWYSERDIKLYPEDPLPGLSIEEAAAANAVGLVHEEVSGISYLGLDDARAQFVLQVLLDYR